MLLIFDLDGTLMDTWDEIEYVFKRVFNRRGVPLDSDKLRMAVGLPLGKVIEKVYGREDRELEDEIRKEFLGMNPRKIKLFSGLEDVFHLPAKKAVFTSKGRLGTYRDLDFLGIREFFDIVITSDDVSNPKPDPEGIIKILNALGERPEKTFMIGDTEMDILAARNAGIKSIAVTWGNRSEMFLREFKPTYIVRDPKELVKILHAHL